MRVSSPSQQFGVFTAALLLLCSLSVQAATFSFVNDGSNPGPHQALNFETNDIQLEITAHVILGDDGHGNFKSSYQPSAPYGIWSDSRGLGVANSFFDNKQLDGFFFHDALLFSFSESVVFEGLSLALFDGVDGNGDAVGRIRRKDDFNFAVGGQGDALKDFQTVAWD